MASDARTAARERFLRYWSLNIAWTGGAVQARSRRGSLGFDPAERARLATLAASMPARAVTIYLATMIMVFLAVMTIAIGLFMAPLLEWSARREEWEQALTFVMALALVLSFSLAFGLPLAMGIGARAGDRFGGVAPTFAIPGDDALAAKIRTQFRRMTFVAIGVFLPAAAALALIVGDTGPLLSWTRAAAFAAAAVSIAVFVLARRRARSISRPPRR